MSLVSLSRQLPDNLRNVSDRRECPGNKTDERDSVHNVTVLIRVGRLPIYTGGQVG